jgi:hypothetical protein
MAAQVRPEYAPIEVVSDATSSLVIVAPGGYRVEGLDVETVVALLARLA